MKTFTCFNCNSQLTQDQLQGIFISNTNIEYSACHACWKSARQKVKDLNPLKTFTCDYCKEKVTDIQTRKRVKIGMPNELKLIRGQEYSFCSNCKDKLDTWTEADDRDWTKEPPEPWE